MIKAVLFDLDDTLLDHDSAIREATAALFDRILPKREQDRPAFIERWIELNREWYKKFYAGEVTFVESGRGKLREAFSPYGDRFEDPEADLLLVDYWEHYVNRCQLFNDVFECLRQLHGYKIGVVTNGQHTQQIEKIERCGILPILDIVVTAEIVGSAKPSPEIFLAASDRLKVRAEECLFIGDSMELDAIAAKNVGMIGIWLERTSNCGNSSVNCINSLAEIKMILSELSHKAS